MQWEPNWSVRRCTHEIYSSFPQCFERAWTDLSPPPLILPNTNIKGMFKVYSLNGTETCTKNVFSPVLYLRTSRQNRKFSNIPNNNICVLMFCWPCSIVNQYSETNVMHFLFSLLRINGLYMFRAFLAHPQEMLNKRHLVYCVRI
jgi:hypothetical protein